MNELPKRPGLKVRIAPVAIADYRRLIHIGLDERGAHLAIERDVGSYFDERRPNLETPPRRDPSGAEIWRAGEHRVIYHVHVHAALLEVVKVVAPHQRWRPITHEQADRQAGTRAHSRLGLRLEHQRTRRSMTAETLAGLAGVSLEVVARLERGDGITDAELSAICDVLDVDVVVSRRLR